MSMLPLKFDVQDHVLCIIPHPDDEALGCSGLLHRAKKSGATVKIVLATDGNRRGKGKLRHQELLASLKCMGLSSDELVRLELPDGYLHQNSGELQEKLQDEVKNFNPTYIVATDSLDRHTDHAVIGQWLEQQKSTATKLTFLVHYLLWPWPFGYFPKAKLRPPKLGILDQQWKVLELSQEEQQVKRGTIAVHKSQHHIVLKPLLLSFIRINELYRVLADS